MVINHLLNGMILQVLTDDTQANFCKGFPASDFSFKLVKKLFGFPPLFSPGKKCEPLPQKKNNNCQLVGGFNPSEKY